MTDSATGIKTTYYYDLTDRLMKYTESGTGYSHSVGYSYDQLEDGGRFSVLCANKPILLFPPST